MKKLIPSLMLVSLLVVASVLAGMTDSIPNPNPNYYGSPAPGGGWMVLTHQYESGVGSVASAAGGGHVGPSLIEQTPPGSPYGTPEQLEERAESCERETGLTACGPWREAAVGYWDRGKTRRYLRGDEAGADRDFAKGTQCMNNSTRPGPIQRSPADIELLRVQARLAVSKCQLAIAQTGSCLGPAQEAAAACMRYGDAMGNRTKGQLWATELLNASVGKGNLPDIP